MLIEMTTYTHYNYLAVSDDQMVIMIIIVKTERKFNKHHENHSSFPPNSSEKVQTHIIMKQGNKKNNFAEIKHAHKHYEI